MARPASSQPTDGELEILRSLWSLGPTELGPLCDALRQSRPVATTTVATMLGVMHKKRLVKRRRGPRGLVWSANVSREAAAKGIVVRLVDRVFDGSASLLVTHLLDNLELSEDDRRQIRDALAKGRELPEQGPQP